MIPVLLINSRELKPKEGREQDEARGKVRSLRSVNWDKFRKSREQGRTELLTYQIEWNHYREARVVDLSMTRWYKLVS